MEDIFGLNGLKIDKKFSKLNVYVSLVREHELKRYPIFRCSEDVYKIFKGLFEADREYFVILILDARSRMTGINVVSVGSLTASFVCPREVFKPAIVGNAASIILIHNHPSGDSTPSREDTEISQRLKECGKMLDIQVVDHIIIGENSYTSMADLGKI